MDHQEFTVIPKIYALPRWLSWLHAALLLVTIWFWGMFLHGSTLHGYVYKRDFSSVYVGARAVAQGRSAQLYDLESQRELMDAAILPYRRYNLLPYIYPGYVAVLLSPLGKLSLDDAFLVWTAINFMAAAWLVIELTGHFSNSRSHRIGVLVAVLSWVPLQLTLGHGQLGLLCGLGFTIAALSLRKNQPVRAGLWLALGLLKPQVLLLPLMVLLLWRCWRTLAAFLSVALLVAGISFVKLGFWVGAYLRFIADFSQKGAGVSLYPAAMQNWRGLVASIFRSDTSDAARLCLTSLIIGTVLLVFLVSRRQGANSGETSGHGLPRDWESRFSIAILAGILASPYLYAHDWVIALPALLLLFQRQSGTALAPADQMQWMSRGLLWMIGLSPFVCFAAQFDLSATKSPISVVPLYMGVLTVLAFFVARRAGTTTAD